MPSKDAKQPLTRPKEQRQKLDTKIQAIENRNKTAERKKDIQRKILVGAYYLQEAMRQGTLAEIKKQRDHFLTRNSDRRLFDLTLLEKEKLQNIRK